MEHHPVQQHVRVDVSEDGADAERVDALTRFLREELLGLDVEAVDPVTVGPPPPGSRALDVVAVGALVVKVVGAVGLRSVVNGVRGWLNRGQAVPRSVRMEIDGDVLELSGASSAEQDRLVDLFVQRHAVS